MAQKSSPNLGSMLFASTFQGQKLENKEISQSKYQRASREVENCTVVSVFANFSTHLSIRLSKICSYPPLASQPASQPSIHPCNYPFIHSSSFHPASYPSNRQSSNGCSSTHPTVELLSTYPIVHYPTSMVEDLPVWLGVGGKTGMLTQYTL